MEDTSMRELSMEEMGEIVGGEISFIKRPDRKGWDQYQVKGTDTLIKIADTYKIKNWRKIREWNPHISHRTNMIKTGEWLWIKLSECNI